MEAAISAAVEEEDELVRLSGQLEDLRDLDVLVPGSFRVPCSPALQSACQSGPAPSADKVCYYTRFPGTRTKSGSRDRRATVD